jgi:Flp pilus assembly protein TadB
MKWLGVAALATLAVYFLWAARSARAAAAARSGVARHLGQGTEGEAGHDLPSRAVARLEGTHAAHALRELYQSSGLTFAWPVLVRCWIAASFILPAAFFLLTRSLLAIPAGVLLALALPGLAMKLLGRQRERKQRQECDGMASDLALFLRSGIPVQEALALCARGLKSPTVVDAMERFASDVALGSESERPSSIWSRRSITATSN